MKVRTRFNRRMQRSLGAINTRNPFIGPLFWILSIQYFIAQVFAIHAWPGYSIQNNTISDLGNGVCGTYSDRYVCSPLHPWMNASFILLGITMMLGAGLIYQKFKQTEGSLWAFTFLAIGGFGILLVGVFPENTVSQLHFLGALLVFFFGNLAIAMFGFVLNMSRLMRIYTLLSGTFALIALGFYVTGHYFGLGDGGMERIVAYPQTAWLVVFGVYISMPYQRFKRRMQQRRNIAFSR